VVLVALAVPRGSVDMAVRLADALMLPRLAPMLVWPEVRVVASPLEEIIVATAGEEEVQVTLLLRFSVMPLAYVPVAANCWVVPSETEAGEGVIVIDWSWSCMVRVVDALNPLRLAEIVVSPVPVLTASPGVEVLMVATVAAEELQVTLAVALLDVPSLYIAVAENCSLFPMITDGLIGLISIAVRTALVTVRLAVPLTVPKVAVIVVWPALSALATPVEAIVATAVADEFQLTVGLRFCWVPSLNVPVAVNCCVVPMTRVGAAGLTAMDNRVAEVMVNWVVPFTEPEVAVMVAGPAATPATWPLAETVATVVAELLQLTNAVRFCWVPSLNVPVAVSGWTAPTSRDGFCGVTWIETRLGPTFRLVEPCTEPRVAVTVLVPLPTPVARALALTVATAVFDELQVDDVVTSWVELLL
jgi:hypothetical protein